MRRNLINGIHVVSINTMTILGFEYPWSRMRWWIWVFLIFTIRSSSLNWWSGYQWRLIAGSLLATVGIPRKPRKKKLSFTDGKSDQKKNAKKTHFLDKAFWGSHVLRTRQIHSIRVGNRYYIYCIWLLLYLTFRVISIAPKIELNLIWNNFLFSVATTSENILDMSLQSLNFKNRFNVPIFHTRSFYVMYFIRSKDFLTRTKVYPRR